MLNSTTGGLMTELILETRDLRKQYQMGDVMVEALRGVDFSVRRGEFVAIMGPSGSGKSTLMHLLGGLDSATGGEIVLGGKRLTDLDDDAITRVRRRDIGFVFQFFNLMPTLTAAENVALPLVIDERNMIHFTARIDELLTMVGLGDRKDHKPHQLSGGQRQRVAIARALVTDPALVLADEPTGNLDSTTSQEVHDLLRRACDENGQTIVMVTHDRRAAATADRVVFLKDGQIVRDLDLEQVQDKTRTQEIFAVSNALEL
jgi:putative ABC transport system ATP-binding protein